jgi:hypothetical protein
LGVTWVLVLSHVIGHLASCHIMFWGSSASCVITSVMSRSSVNANAMRCELEQTPDVGYRCMERERVSCILRRRGGLLCTAVYVCALVNSHVLSVVVVVCLFTPHWRSCQCWCRRMSASTRARAGASREIAHERCTQPRCSVLPSSSPLWRLWRDDAVCPRRAMTWRERVARSSAR